MLYNISTSNIGLIYFLVQTFILAVLKHTYLSYTLFLYILIYNKFKYFLCHRQRGNACYAHYSGLTKEKYHTSYNLLSLDIELHAGRASCYKLSPNEPAFPTISQYNVSNISNPYTTKVQNSFSQTVVLY